MPTRNQSGVARLLAVSINGFCLLIVCALTAVTTEAQHSESGRVDEYIKQRMQELPIPALSVAVVKDSKVILEKGYGAANLETGTPADAETEYRIASLSKQFIAVAVGQNVEIAVTATDEGKAAPDSLVEIEIWDASGLVVYKEHKAEQNFGERETKTLHFSWKPERAGRYSLNVGAYGPKWLASYAWKEKAGSIAVK